MRENLEVKYFLYCPLRQNFTELPFLEKKRCLNGFYCTSSFALLSALKITLSVRTTVEIRCSKMALQQDAGISLGWEGARRVEGNCLLAGRFFCIFTGT